MDDATQSRLLQSILAPVLQPQAQLGLTQQETQTSGQSAATSAQEQQNLQAQNPGIQAVSKTDQINAIKAAAPLNAAKEIQGGMTWDQARQKYTSQGMTADDVFQKYLANTPYGTPVESPDKLISQGVKPETLGQIGQTGSFNDKYNTRNAINEIRTAQNLWNQITPNDILQQKLFGKNENINNYLSYKTTLGNHLQSLIPGASGAQATGQQLLSQLPDPNNIANFGGNVSKGAFNTLENSLLTQKGYSQKELGLGKNTQGSSNTGGELLNNILGAVKTSQELPIGGVSGFNAAAVTLAPLGGILGVGGGGATAATASKVASSAVEDLPGALKQYINPSKAVAQAGSIRDTIIQKASDAGKTINGNDIVRGIKNWAQKGKMGNLGQGSAIDQAVTDAQAIFKGKKIDPKDIMQAYNEADSGFTKTGIPKSPIQANIDRGVRDVLAKELDNVAPGWKEATANMAKSFNAEKSPARAAVKNLVKYGLTLGVPTAAADTLTHYFLGK